MSPVSTAHSRLIYEALKASEVQQSFAKFGADTKIATPQEFAALISSEYRKWSAVAKVNPMNLD